MNDQILNDIMERWAADFVSQLRQEAAKVPRGFGDGANSFDIEFMRMSSAGVATIMVDFKDHLRMRDMRRTNRENPFDNKTIERIKKWVEQKGVQKFMAKYKYPTQVRKKGGGFVDVSTTRILNNIAWGISVKKSRIKPVKWYNRTKGYEIYQLYGSLVNKLVEVSMEEMKNAVIKPS